MVLNCTLWTFSACTPAHQYDVLICESGTLKAVRRLYYSVLIEFEDIIIFSFFHNTIESYGFCFSVVNCSESSIVALLGFFVCTVE